MQTYTEQEFGEMIASIVRGLMAPDPNCTAVVFVGSCVENRDTMFAFAVFYGGQNHKKVIMMTDEEAKDDNNALKAARLIFKSMKTKQ